MEHGAEKLYDFSDHIMGTPSEISFLDRPIGETGNRGAKPGTIQLTVTKLARLGGYLARISDPPPGNTVVWRGWRPLIDIQIGAELGSD